jgi:hypothetical protein
VCVQNLVSATQTLTNLSSGLRLANVLYTDTDATKTAHKTIVNDADGGGVGCDKQKQRNIALVCERRERAKMSVAFVAARALNDDALTSLSDEVAAAIGDIERHLDASQVF